MFKNTRPKNVAEDSPEWGREVQTPVASSAKKEGGSRVFDVTKRVLAGSVRFNNRAVSLVSR